MKRLYLTEIKTHVICYNKRVVEFSTADNVLSGLSMKKIRNKILSEGRANSFILSFYKYLYVIMNGYLDESERSPYHLLVW